MIYIIKFTVTGRRLIYTYALLKQHYEFVLLHLWTLSLWNWSYKETSPELSEARHESNTAVIEKQLEHI